MRANAMAFSFFIALFPAMLFLFTLMPYLPLEQYTTYITAAIMEIMPTDSGTYLTGIVEQWTQNPNGELLSLGFLLTLFFASNGILTMLRGFDKSYEISFKRRNFLQRRGVAIYLTLIMALLLIASMTIVVLGGVILRNLPEWMDAENLDFSLLRVLRWFAILFLFYTGISTIYKFGPALKKKMKFMSPGATLATTLSILSSLVFSWYVNNFGMYNKIYGSIGALIAMMLWLQINSIIILIGYELNASIAVNRDLRGQSKR